jgi:hypothetical protein
MSMLLIALAATVPPADSTTAISAGYAVVCGNYLPPPHILSLRDSTVVLDGVRVWPRGCHPAPGRRAHAIEAKRMSGGQLGMAAEFAVKAARADGDSVTPTALIMAQVYRESPDVDSVTMRGPDNFLVWYKGKEVPQRHSVMSEAPALPGMEVLRGRFNLIADMLRRGYVLFLWDGLERDFPARESSTVLDEIRRIQAGKPATTRLLDGRMVQSLRNPTPVDSLGKVPR